LTTIISQLATIFAIGRWAHWLTDTPQITLSRCFRHAFIHAVGSINEVTEAVIVSKGSSQRISSLRRAIAHIDLSALAYRV
jgi:hypothetical protein